MQKFKLVSLVGITSIALAHAAWAGGHGGGGGGGFGGGGFGGGHPAGAGGGGPRAGGFEFGGRGGGVGFGGSRFSGGMGRFYGGRSSLAMRPSYRHPIYSGQAFHPQQSHFRSVNGRRAQIARPSLARSNQRTLSARNHTFARHTGNWHRDWDRRHAHFWNGHWWCYDGGAWIGLDAGFYPWDYFPYYADDYYPYDYYTGYDADVDQAEYGDVAPSGDQYGDANVANVQSRLANLGYYRGPIDGFFGPATRAALNRYQIDRHLRVTGTPTTDTLRSLRMNTNSLTNSISSR